jgi:hypothetical protein
MLLTAGPGLALVHQDQTRAGVAADVRLLYGLTDAWSARLGLQTSWIPASAGAGATYITAPALGLTVAADILNWVPFAEAGLVLGDFRAAGAPTGQRLGGQLGGGVDYLMTRHLTITLLGHIDYFAFRLAGAGGPRPSQVTFALLLGHAF